MEELTEAQARILKYVTKEIQTGGSPPTFRAIAKAFGFKSTRAAQDHIAALVRKGYLEHKPGVARGLRLPGFTEGVRTAPVTVPIIGTVGASLPKEAVQTAMGSVPFPREHLRSRAGSEPDVFALRVTGDSMMDAGILEGDLVIARAQRTAGHGDIVIALLDGESTVKRLHRKDGKLALVPENGRMKPIPIAQSDLVIQGRVIGVQRFYR